MLFLYAAVLSLVTVFPTVVSTVMPSASPIAGVRIDASEAQATLSVLAKLRRGAPVTASDWNALFATRGYQRLKERKAKFKRSFTDDQFKAFVSSPKLISQSQALADTLRRWMSANITQIAQRSFAYLQPKPPSMRRFIRSSNL